MALFVFCAFFLLAVSAAVEEGNFLKLPRADEHSLVRCDNDDPDIAKWKILAQETPAADAKFLQKVEKTIEFPRSGIGKEIITCIRVTDLVGDGNGGYPDILEGGVGFHYVSLHFISQRSKGFKFSVEIYGKPPPTF